MFIDGEQIKHLWEELNRFKDASVSWGSSKDGDGGQSLGKVVGKLVDQMERLQGLNLDDKLS